MKTRSNVSIALSFLQANTGRGCCGDFFLDWEVDQVHFVITV